MSSNIPYSEFSRIRNRTANIENIEGGTSINGTLRAYNTILGPTPYPPLNPYEYLQISDTINNDAYMTVRNTNVTGILGVLNDNAFVGTVNNKDFHFRINNNSVAVIKNTTGNFGIKNFNPQVPMSIGPTTAAGINSNELLQLCNTTANDAYMTVRSNEATGYYGANADSVYVGSFSNDRFILSSNNRTRACITPDGNFGIGTDFLTADTLLHVNGSAKIGISPSTAPLLYVDDTTNVVGINTSTPDGSTYWLDVNGPSIFRGSIVLESSNLVLSSGNGINFSATANGAGSMSSELFNDYEEGTWSPAISCAGYTFTNSGTPNTFGTYTKIGRMVYFKAVINNSTKTGSGAAAIFITGLPFTAASGQPGYWPAMTSYVDNLASSKINVWGEVQQNGTTIILRTATGATTSLTTNLIGTDINATFVIVISGFYMV